MEGSQEDPDRMPEPLQLAPFEREGAAALRRAPSVCPKLFTLSLRLSSAALLRNLIWAT